MKIDEVISDEVRVADEVNSCGCRRPHGYTREASDLVVRYMAPMIRTGEAYRCEMVERLKRKSLTLAHR